MAHCPDCGSKISSLAEMCPQCGFSLKHTSLLRQRQRARRRKEALKRLIPGFVLLVIGVGLIHLDINVFLSLVLLSLGSLLVLLGFLASIGLELRRIK